MPHHTVPYGTDPPWNGFQALRARLRSFSPSGTKASTSHAKPGRTLTAYCLLLTGGSSGVSVGSNSTMRGDYFATITVLLSRRDYVMVARYEVALETAPSGSVP